MGRRSILGIVLLFTALAAAPASAQNVLVYDSSTNHHAVAACNALALTCTTSGSSDFVTQLTGAAWDVVVVDLPSAEPSDPNWQNAIVTYVDGGGALVFTEWSSFSLGMIPMALEANIVGSHDAVPFYDWGTSALFSSPDTPPSAFTMFTDFWGTNGFYLDPIPPAYAAAGFTMSPATGQAAIVVGNGDRTIFNGFLYDDFPNDENADGTNDMEELLANEISFLLGGGAVMGPCAGLSDGASCTTPRTTGICHAGACCTGCWDGVACRGGSSATTCGRGGVACVSCADGVSCTTDVCTMGTCSNPTSPAGTPCDDGMYCTATDRCTGGTPTCVGTGTPCDDGESCTIDSCDESTDHCSHVRGAGCVIGGTCVGDGIVNPSYPCLVCDVARDTADWSPIAAGTTCTAARCALGHLFSEGTCNATGTCGTPMATPCPTGTCADATTCALSCSAGSCGATEYCAPSGNCMPLGIAGTTCTSDTTCSSGHCVDGVCCEDACDGLCEACDLVPGSCTPIPNNADPDSECPLACNGAGACMMPRDANVADAGAPDAGHDAATTIDASATIDAAVDTEPSSGSCACGIASRASGGGWVLVLAGVLALRRRRRGPVNLA